MGIEQNCEFCYWKIINKDKKGFCYMFEKQIIKCPKFQFDCTIKDKK